MGMKIGAFQPSLGARLAFGRLYAQNLSVHMQFTATGEEIETTNCLCYEFVCEALLLHTIPGIVEVANAGLRCSGLREVRAGHGGAATKVVCSY